MDGKNFILKEATLEGKHILPTFVISTEVIVLYRFHRGFFRNIIVYVVILVS